MECGASAPLSAASLGSPPLASSFSFSYSYSFSLPPPPSFSFSFFFLFPLSSFVSPRRFVSARTRAKLRNPIRSENE